MRNTSKKAQLLIDIFHISIRYEQKTAAILQTMGFLNTVKNEASKNDKISESIHKFDEYLEPNSLNLESHFAGLLLFNLVSEVEIFFVDILKELIKRYPRKIGQMSFDLSQVLDKSRDEIIMLASEKYLNQLMYKKPKEYLDELTSILSIDSNGIKNLWPSFVEAKARRDLGIHNNWQINEVYKKKISEVDLNPSNQKNNLCPSFDYLDKLIPICDHITRCVRNKLEEKYA